jgi:uncharacterized RDD family membrane protein YckC
MLPPAYPMVARDPTDVVGRRIAAAVLDFGFAVVLTFVLFFALASSNDYFSSTAAEDRCSFVNNDASGFCVPVDTTTFEFSDGDLAVILLVPLAYLFVDCALITGITGASIGKLIFGLRVIRQDTGKHCGFGRSLLRWVLWVVDGQPCGVPITGFVTGLVSKGHRRVGDMAAKTLVVSKESVGVPPVVPGLNSFQPAAWAPYAQPGYGQPWGAPQPPPPGYGQPWGTPQPPPPGYGQPWGAPPPPPTPWGAPPPPQPVPPAPQPVPPVPPPPNVPPAPHVPPTPVPAPQPATTPGVDAPMWDDARDAYIQWDPEISAWVQWDDRAKEWHPI